MFKKNLTTAVKGMRLADLNQAYGLMFVALIVMSFALRAFFWSASNLLVEEAYYWNYGQHLDCGYLDHPPMVGVLIRLFTDALGTHELAVRLPSFICWLLAMVWSVQLTRLIDPAARFYAIFFMSILPFFFLQSLVMTPDQPLLACWSFTLYFLYRALVMSEARAWWYVAFGLGFGLLSKYTIFLLVPAAFVYVCWVPDARFWLKRIEPYAALLIMLVLFSPVLWWNSTHHWVSFVFQSARRLNESYAFSLHHVLGLLLFFLLPMGLFCAVMLFKPRAVQAFGLEKKAVLFLKIFTLVPLVVFSLFSLTHPIKFNWIGPGLLALVPWLAVMLQRSWQQPCGMLSRFWLISAAVLLVSYAIMMVDVVYGFVAFVPESVNRMILAKFIDWEHLTQHVTTVADEHVLATQNQPVMVPLDRYNISSELAFYQAKLLAQGARHSQYAVSGSHVFGSESLMYRYWSDPREIMGKSILLVSDDARLFENPLLKQRVNVESPVMTFSTFSQGHHLMLKPFYYQWARLRLDAYALQ